MCPQKFKRGGELPTLATPPRVGPKTLANPKPTRVGNGGPGGGAPWRGVVGGVPPQNLKRGRLPTPANLAMGETQNAGKPQANGGGQNGGPVGRSPPGGGLWGVSPHETKRGGELPTLATPPRVGPKTLANPKPTGVGKGGPRGRGGCAPAKPTVPLHPYSTHLQPGAPFGQLGDFPSLD